MKVLVTGGTGLIGQPLTEALVREGHSVWVLSRDPQNARLSPGVQVVAWDGRTPQGWGHLAGEVDAIINLAGANIGKLPWSNRRKREIRDSRKEAGAAVVAALQENQQRPAVVIQIAGIGIYGPREDEPLDEQASEGSDFQASVVRDWEASTRPVTELGVRQVVMRTAPVLARDAGLLEPFLLQHRLFAGGPIGSGNQWISWIHIHDLVRAFLFLLTRPDAQGVFNVSAPEPVTNATFGRTLGKLMHRPYWFPTPAFMLRLVLGEMSTLVLDGQRVVPVRLQEMGFQFEFGELRKALENLV
jgi:uncharacterized protein